MKYELYETRCHAHNYQYFDELFRQPYFQYVLYRITLKFKEWVLRNKLIFWLVTFSFLTTMPGNIRVATEKQNKTK